jgi:hypothetical protein
MDKQGVMERLRAMYARIEAVAPTATSVFPVLGRDFDEWQATIHAAIARLESPEGEGAAVRDEATQDAIDSLLSTLGDWGKAYPLDIFREPTKDERDWLHTTRPGLMDRIAASMGRHMAGLIARDLAKLRATLEAHPAAPDGYVLVPREPTERMMEVGRDAVMARDCSGPNWGVADHYRASGNSTEDIDPRLLEGKGKMSKGHCAQLVYAAMLAAALK